MQDSSIAKEISNFFVAGINYKKTDATTRGLFAINNDQYLSILRKAKASGIDELFILSTCNRTEIYGFANKARQLIDLLTEEISGDINLFLRQAYIKSGKEAVHHLYKVGTGLDSQILGDYEITSQIKSAFKFAKKNQALGTFTERIINSVLQVSKAVKNQTELSSGTVSVAFAAVKLLKSIKNISNKKILLVGVGKIGRNTCKNMMDYFGTQNITLINRTEEKAADFASKYDLRHAAFKNIEEEVRKADVILVATNASAPTILKSYLEDTADKIVIDLSVPHNVACAVETLPHIRLINIDELSRIQDSTLEMRKQEIPKAKAIIKEQMQDFLYWYQMRKHAVVLQAVKQKLHEIHHKEIAGQKWVQESQQDDVEAMSSRIIQKMINMMAKKVRKEPKSEKYLSVINELFETGMKG